jgi:gluconate:H+ symporter, GntP family
MMANIGIVVILGTMIGTILEKTGATLRIANGIISVFGKKLPVFAITIIGLVVGIPIFCDSGYIILSGLTKPLAKTSNKNYASIVGGLSGGLYVTHTLLPPHPGSLAGAANLGLANNLGVVIIVGLIISVPVAIVTWLFASTVTAKVNTSDIVMNEGEANMENLPSLIKSLMPVIVPVLLIAAGSLISIFSFNDSVNKFLQFAGSPVMALLSGLLLSLLLIAKAEKNSFNTWLKEAVMHAGPILILVGAGGVFGNILKKTPLADMVSGWVKNGGETSVIGFLLIAYLIGCLLKTAQGSTTSAIIVATGIIGPIAAAAGFTSAVALAILLSAIAAGAMMISHANDAYFWVISQFSGMSMKQTYRVFSLQSIVMSIATLIVIIIMALIML